MWPKHNGKNQKWRIVYTDDKSFRPDDSCIKKGKFCARFGFYVNRPFHIISELPAHRYLDVSGGRNIVIKTANKSGTQVWFFDGKSRTVKNGQYTNKSFDIQNAGKSNNL